MQSSILISKNPAKNFQKLGEVPVSSHQEIDKKVTAARNAFASWAATDIKKRKEILDKVYQAFVAKKDGLNLIICREIGMPISTVDKYDVGLGLQFMRGYLDYAQEWLAQEVIFENNTEIHYQLFEPRGVAGVSVPWNYPFCNFVWGVIQNLIVGNTVVFKHSEACPLTGKLIQEILDANLPANICGQVFGDGIDVGDYLMNSNVDLLYFTGSTKVGKHLYQVAAQKFIPAILELGGSAAGIVFEDVDLPETLINIYEMRFMNNGQSCDALKRLIVHRSLFEQVVSGLQKIIASKKLGDPENPHTDLGSLVMQRQLEGIEAQVADAVQKGAQIICGGKRPVGLQGAYYEPTLLANITFDMQVWKEEVFGPVLPIVTFETEQEAIQRANDSQYGLGGCVYSKDKERALCVSKQLQTGNVNVNCGNYVIAQDPFGGYKYSGIGREHGKLGLREFCQAKVIALKK